LRPVDDGLTVAFVSPATNDTNDTNDTSPVEASVTEEDLPLVEIAFGPPERDETRPMEPSRDDEEWPDV